ncbi:MAG TPA: 50S ribosomal protein L4 [Firmicutes bacterium]|nr:50S ribosomal protein L4 [Bacillota bacterium]
MPKVAVYNMEGVQIGDIELNDAIFGVKINEALMHQAVVSHLANRRQGTAATKSRGMVRGGGRKPWRQKGTGRARVGSIRSPLWVGGGVIFGPTPRDHSFSLPKKARRMALKSALSAKVRDGELIVLDELKIDEPKTKLMVKVLKALNADKKPLIVISDWDANIELATRNIPKALLLKSSGLNVYDVLNHDQVIFTKDALTKLEEVLA